MEFRLEEGLGLMSLHDLSWMQTSATEARSNRIDAVFKGYTEWCLFLIPLTLIMMLLFSFSESKYFIQ